MIAIIDIGSNSVRLMLWAGGKTLFKKVSTTRLGEGLARSGKLCDVAMERTIRAVCDFVTEANAQRASVYAFATAAVRGASNGAEFCERVRSACGVEIDIVSGENEAMLGIAGTLPLGCDGGIIDIGGASTEVCYRKGDNIIYRTSLPVGCVRLFDRCGDDWSKLDPEIDGVVAELDGVIPVGTTYAVGGTASTLASIKLGLAAYDGQALQDLPLDCVWMEEIVKKLFRMSKEERKQIAGMDIVRADIIAGGALLLYKVMQRLRLDEIKFSDRDNLEGYLVARGLK